MSVGLAVYRVSFQCITMALSMQFFFEHIFYPFSALTIQVNGIMHHRSGHHQHHHQCCLLNLQPHFSITQNYSLSPVVWDNHFSLDYISLHLVVSLLVWLPFREWKLSRSQARAAVNEAALTCFAKLHEKVCVNGILFTTHGKDGDEETETGNGRGGGEWGWRGRRRYL